MRNPALVVMAAGIGSRYGGLKQIEPIGPSGEIIHDYSIYDAKQAGFGKVVFVINREIEKEFRLHINQTIGQQCEVVYVIQELRDLPEGYSVPHNRKKPWGTAHAVLSCQGEIEAPFAVINADDFYGRKSFQTLCVHLRMVKEPEKIFDFSMVGYSLENTLTEHGHVARGICKVDEEGNLVEVIERTWIEKIDNVVKYSEDGETWTEIPRESVVSMNMWGLTPQVFDELEDDFLKFLNENHNNLVNAEYFLPDVINHLLVEKKATVSVLPTPERWFGITYQADKARVRKAIRKLIYKGVYPEDLWGSGNETKFQRNRKTI
jgi:choline kinase